MGTANSSSATVFNMKVGSAPPIPNARESIACEVTPEGGLRLIPLDALGAYFLHHFGHGEVRATWTLQPWSTNSIPPAVDRNAPQKDLQYLTLRCERPAVLSSGGDPHHTGVALSADEQKACRALVERMRAAAAKKRRQEREAAEAAADPTPTPRKRSSRKRGR